MDNIRLFKIDEIGEGEIREFQKDDDTTIAVYCVEGGYFATDNICTHGEASLSEGDLDGFEIICSWHDGAFDIRSGEATRDPCWKKLATYTVIEKDGWLYLEV